jgi:hypothetical protein
VSLEITYTLEIQHAFHVLKIYSNAENAEKIPMLRKYAIDSLHMILFSKIFSI